MLEGAIIIGVTMVLVEIAKTFPVMKKERGKLFLQLCVLAVAGALMVCNALVFGGMEWRPALSEGIKLGAIASGIYAIGKKKTSTTENGTKAGE